MEIKFLKMHGAGNDFVIVDNRNGLNLDFSDLARKICDRRFGVGADGLLLLEQKRTNLSGMRIFNADGSEAEMCGNGLRCLAAYIYELGLADKEEFPVWTKAGIRYPKILKRSGLVWEVSIDMGPSTFCADEINFVVPEKLTPDYKDRVSLSRVDNLPTSHFSLQIKPPGLEENIIFVPVSMGNPHLVGEVKNLDFFPVRKIGSWIEKLPIFPHGINVEFIERVEKNHLRVRVWERGVGETPACGTGACAAGIYNIFFGSGEEEEQKVELPGGTLKVFYKEGRVKLTGPATKVFSGIFFNEEVSKS